MSNRERWVVYPLLIWSLGMGFRSQYDSLFERSNLECRELRIVDQADKTRLRLSADSVDGGGITLIGSEGEPTVTLREKGGLVTFDEDKKE